jgi:hypothetical protein
MIIEEGKGNIHSLYSCTIEICSPADTGMFNCGLKANVLRWLASLGVERVRAPPAKMPNENITVGPVLNDRSMIAPPLGAIQKVSLVADAPFPESKFTGAFATSDT